MNYLFYLLPTFLLFGCGMGDHMNDDNMDSTVTTTSTHNFLYYGDITNDMVVKLDVTLMKPISSTDSNGLYPYEIAKALNNKLYVLNRHDNIIGVLDPITNSIIDEVNQKDNINKILHFDTRQLLPGNNLVKPDKMAMANSLETRSPLLDYRLFELIQTIPGKYKLQDSETKYILKKFALKYLPHDIVYRKKQMFTVPVGEWFKTNLKDYVVDIITSDSLKSRGIFNISYLNKILDEHINEKKDYTRELRAIVNLELWFRRFNA